MAEPYDVEKRNAKKGAPTVRYTMHDSDDEDHDTSETRKSLKTAERMLNTRFFTNETDRRAYKKHEEEGTLREAVKNFEETDDHVTATEDQVASIKEESDRKKAEAQKLREIEEDADKAKAKAQKEVLEKKIAGD
jgi:hypothetical protein